MHLALLALSIWPSSRMILVEDFYRFITLFLMPLLTLYKNKGCFLDGEENENLSNRFELIYWAGIKTDVPRNEYIASFYLYLRS